MNLNSNSKSTGVKLAFIFLLIIILLVPIQFMKNLIRERSGLKSEVVHTVGQSWGGAQLISGPLLSIPYEVISYDADNDKQSRTSHFIHILPETLNITAKNECFERKRSIYLIPVYNSDLSISGQFDIPDKSEFDNKKVEIQYEKASLSLGISDHSAIQSSSQFVYQNTPYEFESGTAQQFILGKGIHCPFKLNEELSTFDFDIHLDIRGNSSISFAPSGEKSTINVSANWEDPSFFGSPSPDFTIEDGQFQSTWKTNKFNRTAPSFWKDNAFQLNQGTGALGVKLFQLVDHYQKNERTIKYALLIIVLTFMCFFFFESIFNIKIHFIHYILVGAGLALYYLLVLSFSEHITFNVSYWVAAMATTLLITSYTQSIIKNRKSSTILFSLLSGLYAYLFILLQMGDYALIAGSIGLFLILSGIMFITRGIEWG